MTTPTSDTNSVEQDMGASEVQPLALEFRPDHKGHFDEIVARFADGLVHVETMTDKSCYVGFYWDDGRYCQWWISADKKLRYSHEDGKGDPPRYTAWGIDRQASPNPSPSPCRTSDSDVERVAAIIAPHLRYFGGINPDVDDQNRSRDQAVELARAALATLSPSPEKIREEALEEAAKVVLNHATRARSVGNDPPYPALIAAHDAIRSLTKDNDPAREEQR